MRCKEMQRTVKEVSVNYLSAVLAVVVIPCNVDSVPYAVLHLNVIPHMCSGVLFVPVAENINTWDIKCITYYLESLGIALTDCISVNKSSVCGRIVDTFCGVVCIKTDIVMDILDDIIPCICVFCNYLRYLVHLVIEL